MFLRPACASYDEKLEAYLAEKRKETKDARCEVCKITRPLRAFHCRYCNMYSPPIETS